MILQKLYELHDALAKDDSYALAPEGYSIVSISFVIDVVSDGSYEIVDYREEGRGRQMSVPGPKAHSNTVEAFPFRDTASYLLGLHQGEGKPENTVKRFQASKAFHQSIASAIDSEEVRAVARFFEKVANEGFTPKEGLDLKMFLNSGVFRYRSSSTYHFVHELPEVRTWGETQSAKPSGKSTEGLCLITNRIAPLALTHTPAIGGNMPSPAQAKAPIVAFNKGKQAFESYGNSDSQALNASISQEAATKYCKALNTLLSDSRHHFPIGETTCVFWTEKPTPIQKDFSAYFSGKNLTKPNTSEITQENQLLDALGKSTQKLRQGIPSETELPDSGVPFHLLGLTGQAGGRIGIRFHLTSTLGELATNLAKHHNDLAIERPRKNNDGDKVGFEYPSIRSIMELTGREAKNQPATLIQGLVSSIIQGSPYPLALPQLIISRIRADRHIDPTINKDKALETYQARQQAYLRAATLKAFLNRNILTKTTDHKMNEAIDPTRKEPAYHLGRLFAVYETAQKSAQPGINRTIRETMYSAASATPLAVFGRLERLHHHHTAKKSHPFGSSESYADIIAIIKQNFKGNPLTPYPRSLNLTDQSFFAVGYYHQLQHFNQLAVTKRNEKTTKTENKQPTEQ